MHHRCVLVAIASAPQKFKGIAVVPNDCSLEQLEIFKTQGVIGIAFNLALMGFDLLRRHRALAAPPETTGSVGPVPG